MYGAVCGQCCGKAGIIMAVTSVARCDLRPCWWRPREVTAAFLRRADVFAMSR